MSQFLLMSDLRQATRVSPQDEPRVLAPLLDSVVADFEGATGRLWLRRVGYVWRHTIRETEMHSGRVWLPLDPIETIEVRHHAVSSDESTAVVLPSTSYRVEDEALIRLDGTWTGRIIVTMTGGYAAHDPTAVSVPAYPKPPRDIVEAIKAQALMLYSRLNQGVHGVASGGNVRGGSAELVKLPNHPLYEQAVRARKRLWS